MTPFVSMIVFLMALATVVLDIVIVLKLLVLFKASWRNRLVNAMRAHGLELVFVVSTLAVAGTLFMQFAGGLNPCDLCWWQRIFMYPIAFISLVALIKDKKLSDVADYLLVLASIGALFALYQHLLQVLPAGSLLPCDPNNDCAIRAIFYFNFVTIPWMSLTVFATVIVTALLVRCQTAR